MAMELFLQQTAPVSRDQLREQIRQTVRDATQAAQEAVNAAADAKGAAQSGHNIVVPLPPPPPGQSGTLVSGPPEIPPQVEPISIAFFAMIAIIVVGLPLMRAIARRIDKGSQAPPPIPLEITNQLQQISQSVDAIAIEVERISEGQRFTTKILADKQREGTMITPGASGQQ